MVNTIVNTVLGAFLLIYGVWSFARVVLELDAALGGREEEDWEIEP